MSYRKLAPGFLALALVFPLIAQADPLPDGLYAEFSTSMGDFTCELDYTGTPRTVANLVGLAEATRSWGIDRQYGRLYKSAFYEGVIFHRVITNFMIQAGIDVAPLSVVLGFEFADEFTTASSTNVDRGVLAMANAGPDTNTGQFFIPVNDQPHLDGVHTVFGHVVVGMDVVDAISLVPTVNTVPVTPVVINSVTIQRIGTDAQNWDPAEVMPPLPAPFVLQSSISNDMGNLIVEWGYAGPLGTHLFYTADLADTNAVLWINETGFGGISLGSFPDTNPWVSFWTLREDAE